MHIAESETKTIKTTSFLHSSHKKEQCCLPWQLRCVLIFKNLQNLTNNWSTFVIPDYSQYNN